MITFKNGCAAAALALALPIAAMSPGHAAPLAPSQSVIAAQAGANNSLVTEVQYRRHYHGGGYYRGGAGVGIGLAAGALIGGAIAAGANPYYGPGYGYAPGYGYGYGPRYYSEPVVVAPGYGGGDAEAYCMRRYRSYDPASGTYLNNDGNRYPCP